MKNQIEMIIEGRPKDLGIPVARVLPWVKKRMVGPFIFLDRMGPVELHPPQDHLDVRPHPHIGLSTLTYLFEGEIFHRDSLGVEQLITPGAVNWMTAGKGISHSEREPDNLRFLKRSIHGLQFWVALPVEHEDTDPSFYHYEAEEIPVEVTASHEVKIIAGEKNGKSSPLRAYSPMTFQVITTFDKGKYEYSHSEFELAAYIVKGKVFVGEAEFREGQMIVFQKGSSLEIEYEKDALFAIIGGVPFSEPRYIWWNFVSSSQAKIEAAKVAWQNGSFPQVKGDHERIPLPVD